MMHRVLGVAMTLVLLAGCSLIVRSKLDDENGKPDSGLPDSRVDTTAPRPEGPRPDAKPDPLIIRGERGQQGSGPYVIGENLEIELPESILEQAPTHVVLRSLEMGWALPCRRRPGDGDELVKMEGIFRCAISAGSPDGVVQLEVRKGPLEDYRNKDASLVITTAEIRIVRRLVLGGDGHEQAYYFDAMALDDGAQQGEINLKGAVAGQLFPLLSPSGRYLLLTQHKPLPESYFLVLVDLVLATAVSLPSFVVLPPQDGWSPWITAHSFEPELAPPPFPKFPAEGPAKETFPFPQHLPERWLWVVNQEGQLFKMDLTQTIKNGICACEPADMGNVRQVLWVTAPSGEKGMVGLTRAIETPPPPPPNPPYPLKYAFFRLTNPDQPAYQSFPPTEIYLHQLAPAYFRDAPPGSPKGQAPIVLVLAYDPSVGEQQVFGFPLGAGPGTPLLPPTRLEWMAYGIFPAAMISVPGTGLVGFHSPECPSGDSPCMVYDKTFFGSLNSEHCGSGNCFSVLTGPEFTPGFPFIGFPTGFARERLLFQHGKHLEVWDPTLAPAKSVMSWQINFSLTHATHHPLRDLVYAYAAITMTPKKGSIYRIQYDAKNTKVDVDMQTFGGVIIQP